jgi:hypothetical protein
MRPSENRTEGEIIGKKQTEWIEVQRDTHSGNYTTFLILGVCFDGLMDTSWAKKSECEIYYRLDLYTANMYIWCQN